MAEARVDLVLGNSQFLQGISQADAAQKRFAGSWEANIGRIFKRSPFARAERAIEEFALQLGSGNLGGAFAALGSRVTGLGLAVGVAFGAGIGLVQKFRGEMNAIQAAVKNVNRELAMPEEVQGGLGSGIGSVIDRQQKLLEDLQAKSDTLTGKFLSAGRRTSALQAGGFTQEEIDDIQKNGPEGAQQRLYERITALTKDRAVFEEKIAKAKTLAASGDKLGASLLQNQLAAEQAIAELRERAGKDNTFVLQARLQQDIATVNALRAAQDAATRRQFVGEQQSFFQKAVGGFDLRTAATTEQFLRDKIAADPFNPNNPRFQLQADQLNLFRNQSDLANNRFIDDSTIVGGSTGARVFSENLRQKISAQQADVDNQTARVFNEQRQFNSSNQGIESRLDVIATKMDEYWK